jgi:hypothetical protein
MRAMCRVSIVDGVRNYDVYRRCGSVISIGERMYINALRRYGHVVRMEEERMVKIVYCAKIEGSRARGRPKMRWMYGVKASVERKIMNVEEVIRCVQDRGEWRRVVDP